MPPSQRPPIQVDDFDDALDLVDEIESERGLWDSATEEDDYSEESYP